MLITIQFAYKGQRPIPHCMKRSAYVTGRYNPRPEPQPLSLPSHAGGTCDKTRLNYLQIDAKVARKRRNSKARKPRTFRDLAAIAY